jgi:hypothetical protein
MNRQDLGVTLDKSFALRRMGDSSGDETDRSALVDERACQLAVFSGKLPSMEAEIDCKLQSNSP